MVAKLENVGLRYTDEKEILKDINLEIKARDFYFLTGLSGSGKTSLINMLHLSLKPTRGIINLFNKDVTKISFDKIYSYRRKIGCIFQDFKLIENISVFDNIAIPLRIINMPPKKIEEHVISILKWVDLENYASFLINRLSGGQKQLVAVCRAVITNPSLILADEPTASIDHRAQKKLMYLLENLNKSGTAIIFATHNKAIIESYSHDILYIKNRTLKKVNNLNETDL